MLKNKTVSRLFFVIFSLFTAVSLAYAESCSSTGAKEKKFIADEDPGCSYTTQTRTCCSNKQWSGWDEECPNCGERECWTGSKCSPEPPAPCSCTNGTCTRIWTCTPGTDWSYTDGTCVCNSGYTLRNGKCMKCFEWKYEKYDGITCEECWDKIKNDDKIPLNLRCSSDSQINCYWQTQTNMGTHSCIEGTRTGGSSIFGTMEFYYGSGTTHCQISRGYRYCTD